MRHFSDTPCIVPGCDAQKTIAKGLCRHHYDHRYSHYKTTGLVLTAQEMADHPISRKVIVKPRDDCKWAGRHTGEFGKTTVPHPDAPLNPVIPDRRKVMIASPTPFIEDDIMPAYGLNLPDSVMGKPAEELSDKSDTLPKEEKISEPNPAPTKAQVRRAREEASRTIQREILIARLDWLQAALIDTIRELKSF